jgi:mono/diheme cytochrome c family protein
MEASNSSGNLATGAAKDAPPHLVAASDIEAGRYLVIVGGCNDCHTETYLQTGGDVPEEDWLAGSMLGWRGPWGTTYPPNLRLRVQEWTEDVFVQTVHERKALPPMPWVNVNQMSEQDARAIYRYIRSLGPIGEQMPAPVPPDQEPTTPYLSLMPIQPGASSGTPAGQKP